jgi:hypothetical protein
MPLETIQVLTADTGSMKRGRHPVRREPEPPLTFFTEPGQAWPGPGKSGGAGMGHCPCDCMAWGVLPPVRLVREPLMGTCADR